MRKLAVLLLFAASAFADPVPTNVTVHVVARDAKLIYEQVGGAWVSIADAGSGRILAEGLHSGKSSGSTQKIMVDAHARGAARFDTPDAAAFHGVIPLERPTVVRITAEGPRGFPQAKSSASKTLLLLPGEHVTGDGIVLELNGLIVVAQPPQNRGEDVAEVTATVQMACGCRLEAGGLWNADEFKVTATVIGRDGTRSTHPMRWEGDRWIVSLPRPLRGAAAVEVIAAHTPTANFGIHKLDLE